MYLSIYKRVSNNGDDFRTTILNCTQFGHARGVRGPKSTVPSSAILVGSVAAERSYRGLGTLAPEFPILGGGGGGSTRQGPYACSMSFLFIIVPIPFLVGPFISSRIPCFRPQEKKSARCCRFESLRDSGFIAPNLAFYRPYKAQTDI